MFIDTQPAVSVHIASYSDHTGGSTTDGLGLYSMELLYGQGKTFVLRHYATHHVDARITQVTLDTIVKRRIDTLISKTGREAFPQINFPLSFKIACK